MKTGMRGGPLAGLIAIAIGLVACGGGSSGPPKTLSLSGEKVPVSEVTTASLTTPCLLYTSPSPRD